VKKRAFIVNVIAIGLVIVFVLLAFTLLFFDVIDSDITTAILSSTLTVVTAFYALIIYETLQQQRSDSEQHKREWETSMQPLVILSPVSDKISVEKGEKISFAIDVELNNHSKDIATHVLYYVVPVHNYNGTKTEGSGVGLKLICNLKSGEHIHFRPHLVLERNSNDLRYTGSDEVRFHFVCISRSLSGKWYKSEIVNYIYFDKIVETIGSKLVLSDGEKTTHKSLPSFSEIEESDILKEKYRNGGNDDLPQYRGSCPLVTELFHEIEEKTKHK
jgi:hypothetical protein